MDEPSQPGRRRGRKDLPPVTHVDSMLREGGLKKVATHLGCVATNIARNLHIWYGVRPATLRFLVDSDGNPVNAVTDDDIRCAGRKAVG